MGWLNDDVALVTGANSGIGLAVVRRFIAEGARGIGVLIRSAAQADVMRQEFGDKIVVTVGDVQAPEANREAVDTTLRRFGKLDTLVGNAGVWDHFASLRKFDGATLAATSMRYSA
jgi:NAD(P)-dependent dehydrogenase (short-subunit alcohol dehydrogenase family)